MSDCINYLLWMLGMGLIALLSYFIPFYKANVKIEKNWEKQNKQITALKSQLDDERQVFTDKKIAELNQLSEKETEVLRAHQKTMVILKEAESIRENAKIPIQTFQQRIDQLQLELRNARKRAERLANRSKKAENIAAQ